MRWSAMLSQTRAAGAFRHVHEPQDSSSLPPATRGGGTPAIISRCLRAEEALGSVLRVSPIFRRLDLRGARPSLQLHYVATTAAANSDPALITTGTCGSVRPPALSAYRQRLSPDTQQKILQLDIHPLTKTAS